MQPAEESILHFSSHRNRNHLSAALKLSVSGTQAEAKHLTQLNDLHLNLKLRYLYRTVSTFFFSPGIGSLLFFIISKFSGNVPLCADFTVLINFRHLCTKSPMKWRSRLDSWGTNICTLQIRK